MDTASDELKIQEKTWLEFRDSGLLWFTNRLLHVFGWAIVFYVDEESEHVVRAAPARINARGFAQGVEENGFVLLTQYMLDNIDSIASDIELVNKE